MTYKEKMKKEHPTVDSNFVLFSCPGHYFDNAPEAAAGNGRCLDSSCSDCWNREIPDVEPAEKTDVKKLATRVKALYDAFRDEGLNHPEAFDMTKIVISAEIKRGVEL